MIKIKPIKQTRGYCGPASLKIIMDYYGVDKSQNEWARLTKTSRIKGCLEENIVNISKKLGFKAFVKKNSSIREIRKLVNNDTPIIVDWYSPEEEGHYSVVVGINKGDIIIADPHFGKIVKHKLEWFGERWFDVVNNKKINREIIVIRR